MDDKSTFVVYCFYNKTYYEAFVQKKILTDMVPSLHLYLNYELNQKPIYSWEECYYKKESI